MLRDCQLRMGRHAARPRLLNNPTLELSLGPRLDAPQTTTQIVYQYSSAPRPDQRLNVPTANCIQAHVCIDFCSSSPEFSLPVKCLPYISVPRRGAHSLALSFLRPYAV